MKNLPDFFRSDLRPYLDRFLNEGWGWDHIGMPEALEKPPFMPSCDAEETETQYLLSFDLPGVRREEIKVDFHDGLLTISGERHEARESKDKNRTRTERFSGTYQRSIRFPIEVDSSRIEAHYADGVLRLTVPKAQASTARRIAVSDGKSAKENGKGTARAAERAA